MREYIIEIERQNNLMWIVKVNAKSLEEAKMKAAAAVMQTDDFFEVTEEEAKNHQRMLGIPIIDEDGEEYYDFEEEK